LISLFLLNLPLSRVIFLNKFKGVIFERVGVKSEWENTRYLILFHGSHASFVKDIRKLIDSTKVSFTGEEYMLEPMCEERKGG